MGVSTHDEAELDIALAAGPDHLSAYALTVEPGTKLWREVRGGAAAPDPDDQADKYELVQEAAAVAGLIQYEVSNFARPGAACRYNLATWGQSEYLGFGLGARGQPDQRRRGRNIANIKCHSENVGTNRIYKLPII